MRPHIPRIFLKKSYVMAVNISYISAAPWYASSGGIGDSRSVTALGFEICVFEYWRMPPLWSEWMQAAHSMRKATCLYGLFIEALRAWFRFLTLASLGRVVSCAFYFAWMMRMPCFIVIMYIGEDGRSRRMAHEYLPRHWISSTSNLRDKHIERLRRTETARGRVDDRGAWKFDRGYRFRLYMSGDIGYISALIRQLVIYSAEE